MLSKEAIDVKHKLRIYNNETETTKCVKLLGVEIDFQTKFNERIYLPYVLKLWCNWTLFIDCKGKWVKLKRIL